MKEVGVYHKKGGEWVELLPEVVNWRTGSVLKNIATAGLVKGDINGFMLGSDGRNSVKSLVEILIYAAEGVAITDYQLLRLRQKGDQREFRIVTGGIFPRISVLNIWVQLCKILQRLYSCGFQHDQPLLEGETQWVRNRISRFSFPSTRL